MLLALVMRNRLELPKIPLEVLVHPSCAYLSVLKVLIRFPSWDSSSLKKINRALGDRHNWEVRGFNEVDTASVHIINKYAFDNPPLQFPSVICNSLVHSISD